MNETLLGSPAAPGFTDYYMGAFPVCCYVGFQANLL